MAAKIANRRGFERALWGAVEPCLEKQVKADLEWRKSIRESHPIGKLPIPERRNVLRRDEFLLQRLFHAYREITFSFDALVNSPLFVAHFPSGLSKKISRSSWLRYHTESYLHELYIFQNRAEVFFALLQRAYRKDPDAATLKRSFDDLEKSLKDGLSNVICARGRHVHDHRFDDLSLWVAEGAEYLQKLGAKSRRRYSGPVKDATFEKVFWMKRSNSEIEMWLDENGRRLGRLLFKRDGSFRFPSATQ